MRHAWIVAGLVLDGGCGQTGALYLPQDDAQAPVVLRPATGPATDGSGPATAPSSTAPPESPTRSTQPATGTTGEGAPPERRDGKPAGSPPPKTAP